MCLPVGKHKLAHNINLINGAKRVSRVRALIPDPTRSTYPQAAVCFKDDIS